MQLKQGFSRSSAMIALTLSGLAIGVASCGNASNDPVAVLAAERIKTPEYKHPEDFVQMEATYDRNGGVGTIAGTLKNVGKFAAADFRLKCRARGDSGKILDKYDLTITKTVRPGETEKFGPLDVGYLDQQAVSLRCDLKGAEIAY